MGRFCGTRNDRIYGRIATKLAVLNEGQVAKKLKKLKQGYKKVKEHNSHSGSMSEEMELRTGGCSPFSEGTRRRQVARGEVHLVFVFSSNLRAPFLPL